MQAPGRPKQHDGGMALLLRRALLETCRRSMAHTPASRVRDLATDWPGIEVERKFLLPEDMGGLRALIEARGGELVAEKSFTDSYFDGPGFALTLADYWLRRRDSQWELKVPGQHVGGTAVYTEVEEEGAIAVALTALLAGGEKGDGRLLLADVVKVHQLEPCATFGTVRQSFAVPGGFHIDLDTSSFGYGIGEIELMCKGEAEVASAAKRIGQLGEELGVVMAQHKGHLRSKVSMVLLKERPEHFAALVAGGVIE